MVMCFNFYLEAGGWLSSECLFDKLGSKYNIKENQTRDILIPH